MYRNKKDVDKHVENLLSKLSVKEFKTRAYSLARLYFEVGDFVNCQKYVEQYLTQKDNNAAAYKLLGQTLHKLGQKEEALEQYKTSLDIDPTQTSTILDICEILSDEDVTIDQGRAKFWCEKAEAIFPRHPIAFRLRERLVKTSNPDPEAIVNLLIAELSVRPKDVVLHIRLLKHYLQVNKFKEAFEHSCNVEFNDGTFIENYAWYEMLVDLFKNDVYNTNDWLYQLLLLTVRERICMLSLTEIPAGTCKSLIESNELLHVYDQAIEYVAKVGPCPNFAEFHAGLLQHHRGQFGLHAATLLLKKAKKSQLNWRDAVKLAGPLMLTAWHTTPIEPGVNWLKNAPQKQINAVNRWYFEGTYRCSQSGHYLLANVQDKSLDQISQSCSGTHWRDKLYEKIFPNRIHLTKIKTSHFVSNAFTSPVLRLPRKHEIETYDSDAQRYFGSSLHHFVWTLLNYKNFAHFKCTLFDMLTPTVNACGPESLNKLDIQAFLYCAALACNKDKFNESSFLSIEKPLILPANITDILCPLPQLKWWDCAYKFSKNGLGTELTDIRATLTRGIEVVRCIDNHGLDAELLSVLGRIFSDKAKNATNIDEKKQLELRATLYYSSAIPILEKLRSKMVVKIPEKRMFDYTHKDLNTKDINALLEESKLYVARRYLDNNEYGKVIEVLSNLKSPQAYFYQCETYKKLALEENNLSKDDSPETISKYSTLLNKAKQYGYKALNRLKETEISKNHSLYVKIQELIEDIDTNINKIDLNLSGTVFNDEDGRYSSDEEVSTDHIPIRSNRHLIRNMSSTPKAGTNVNLSNYRTATDTQSLESTHVNQKMIERIENEIKNINEFMLQAKSWFDENRNLGNQIMTTIQTNIENNTDQFKLLKISVDHVRDEIDKCRNECKDVGELKKQIAELKKEVNKLKKSSSEQTIDEHELYNLDDDYRTNDTTSTFSSQIPFAPSHVIPPFNQRLVAPFPVPPNPYQLYGQTLYNLYNQYSQTTSTSGATPMYDPTRTQVNYPTVYPTPEQFYVDMTHFVPSNVSAAPSVPIVPTVPVVPPVPPAPTVPAAPKMNVVSASSSTSLITSKANTKDAKEISRSLPVNVVITSSDPLPTTTVTPAPVLSVTIPSKHIKGTPHNYQIPMPSINETKAVGPPVFSFPFHGNKTNTTTNTASSLTWHAPSTQTSFKSPQSNTETSNLFHESSLYKSFNDSKSVVDGSQSSPNINFNKSRTLSEKSNTSVENFDPCPDFKPIVPLPDEVKVKTGEEDETVIFCARAKLYRFVDKEWKERGLGEMKLLKHKENGKVRVLMRREQIHKVCANHIISPEMEIKPMMNESKAYFWVAHDFADGSVVLEKFCIRFKTADIAQEFYNTFQKARQESLNAFNNESSIKNTCATEIENSQINIPVRDKAEQIASTPQGKAIVGGFTFSSTPNFKPLSENNELDVKPSEQIINKPNIFGELVFKTTSSPFSNLFSATGPQQSSPNSIVAKQASDKLNVSDTIEEFEPSVDFKPVIPLPALVEQKTGEEDEVVLFEHRAKLLRFDPNTKEWKERGLGNIKLLVHKENSHKARLLMRREQIMKVCCNHAVTKEMIFQKMPNIDKAVTWCAKDFSEGELVAETFCLRFKTVQVCDNFVDAIKCVQSKMKDESKAAKEEQNAAKQTMHDKVTIGWGDSFKPKPGSWECQKCLIRNEADISNCSACNNPKESILYMPENKATNQTTSKFSFGIPSQTMSKVEQKNEKTIPTISAWGDQFKPKEGSWECKSCLVRNEGSLENCSACNSPKDPNEVKKDSKSIFNNNSSTVKFHFGLPPVASNQPNASTDISTTSIFDGTGAHKFSFGIPKVAVGNVQPSDSGKDPIPTQTKINLKSDSPINFSLKNNSENNKVDIQKKAPLLPTPQTDSVFKQSGAKESGTFGFTFTPKTTTNDITCEKLPQNLINDSENNEWTNKDDSKISITSKDLLETVEENGTSLYSQQARLFRFVDGEWKERGVGTVKILKHSPNNKLRVIMWNDQTSKVCLNHTLTPEITYTPKDDQTWLFTAYDFSEGEASLQQFSLNFDNKDITLQFKKIVDKARAGMFHSDIVDPSKDLKSETKVHASEDVIFVSEIHATLEEKEEAKKLMLPENFFTYRNKEPCQGCRGCENDEPKVSPSSTRLTDTELISVNLNTPRKSSNLSFLSPTNSVYGTPSNYEKTSDTSIFRTPLGSVTTSTIPATPTLSQLVKGNILSHESKINYKENIFNENTKNFEQSIEKTSFEPRIGSATTLASGDIQQSKGNKISVLAPSKLSTLNAGVVIEATHAKPSPDNLGFGDVKSMFGNANLGSSINKSIFDIPIDKNLEKQNEEVKSIFGGNNQYSTNLFSKANKDNIFGPITTSEKDNIPTTGIFGASSQNTLFGNVSQQQSVYGNMFTQKCDLNLESDSNNLNPDLSSCNNKINIKIDENEDKREMMPAFDSNLSFADLSTNDNTTTFQKKENFKWEGAGQQLFSSAKGLHRPKADGSEAGDETAGAAARDEEYDPHYEPIVPLPDKIIVTTGEEDEQKLFGERCKLYRYDEKTREWKERGVGEMKILYHPERNMYRLLLRREQVHKAVLNMLLFNDLEMLPMMKSDRAWTWAGINYAENPSGVQETLAVRFKSTDLANSFHEQVIGAVRKLQAAAAKAIADEKNAEPKAFENVAPLRLPKHLEDNARADPVLTAATEIVTKPISAEVKAQAAVTKTETKTNSDMNDTPAVDMFKQVQFQEPEEEEEQDDDYEYDHDEYDPYYNEEEEEEDESGAYYSCDGEAEIVQGENVTKCEHARIMVTFDQDIYSPKILVADSATGEILTDMLIHTDTEFQLCGDSCIWSGRDFTSNDPVDKTVRVNFFDSETAMRFYDSCETSKAATYSSTDPES